MYIVIVSLVIVPKYSYFRVFTIFASDCDSFYRFPVFIMNALMLSTALHFTRYPSYVQPMPFPL